MYNRFDNNINNYRGEEQFPRSASYIITDKSTGKVIFETFSASVARKVNTLKYNVATALEHLVSLNNK